MTSSNAQRPRASFEQWLQVFNAAYEAPDGVGRLRCPECGANDLVLQFVLYGKDPHEGRVAFWCNTCHFGIAPGRITVPAGGETVRLEDAHIPKYRIVPPTSQRSDDVVAGSP